MTNELQLRELASVADVHPRAGWDVRWDAGETHTSRTDTGLVALAVEGTSLDLFELEEPEL
ncbi:MAG: hypothetical protein JO132_03770 [Streptosporangiaceae bacterium]|nr:hypothetical protein [Streptosporangiaceae bacterium]